MLSKSLTIAAAGNSLPPEPDPVWNLNTATFNGTTRNYYNMLDHNRCEGGLMWVDNGLHAYSTTGSTGFQWAASTAFDVSTISLVTSISLSNRRNYFVRADGLRLYASNVATDEIEEYTLSTAYDLSSLSLTRSFSVAAENVAPAGLFFKSDGTKMYSCYSGTTVADQKVYEYTLSTAWNISTASYSGNSYTHSVRNAKTLTFDPSGTYMYISSDVIFSPSRVLLYQYTLGTAFNVSTASLTRSVDLRGIYSNRNPQVWFNQTGTKMFFGDSESTLMWSLDLSTAWNISTLSFTPPSDSAFVALSTVANGFDGMYIDPDGNHLYRTSKTDSDTVYQYAFGTAFDLRTLSYVRSFSVAGQEATPVAVTFKPDGTKMYVVGTTGDDVNEYSLGTAWDISTASFVQTFSVGAQDTLPYSIVFKPDGTKMYIYGATGRDINEYALSSAWDVSSASFVRASASLISYITNQYAGIYFRSDGYYLYISTPSANSDVPPSGVEVNEFSLSTAWDVSTLTFVQRVGLHTSTVPLNKKDNYYTAISFNPDGSQLFLADGNLVNKFICSFDMTPPTP